jgi:osmotically inducible protein OsmC
MKINRKASADWHGGLKTGRGELSTDSGALSAYPYGFGSRFEGTPGSNPEELLGAAHAGCFTMAMALALEQAGLTAEHMHTGAVVTLAQEGEGFSITTIKLELEAKIPGLDDTTFQAFALEVKAACPVSKVLRADIILEAKLL